MCVFGADGRASPHLFGCETGQRKWGAGEIDHGLGLGTTPSAVNCEPLSRIPSSGLLFRSAHFPPAWQHGTGPGPQGKSNWSGSKAAAAVLIFITLFLLLIFIMLRIRNRKCPTNILSLGLGPNPSHFLALPVLFRFLCMPEHSLNQVQVAQRLWPLFGLFRGGFVTIFGIMDCNHSWDWVMGKLDPLIRWAGGVVINQI